MKTNVSSKTGKSVTFQLIVAYVVFMALIMVYSCTAKAQSNILSSNRINIGFGCGPNYLFSDKSSGYSTEISVGYKTKIMGMEVGIGTYENFGGIGNMNFAKTLKFMKIGPTYTIDFGRTDLVSNVYIGYANSSVEKPDELAINRFYYGGISQKLQFTFTSICEESLNIAFFAKAGVDLFPSSIALEQTEKKTVYSFTGVIGFAFKAIPNKNAKGPRNPTTRL